MGVRMFKSVTYFAEEIDLQYNDRILIYCIDGFSYWYRGKEKTNKKYTDKHHKNRFETALKNTQQRKFQECI